MRKPPGPRGLDVLGFFGYGSVPNSLAFLEKTSRRYGALSYFRLLHQRTYFVDDPELIKQVLVVQQHRFQRDVGATILRELVGDGLLTRDEPLHRERRRILQPAFHREQVASYVEIIASECTRHLSSWREDTPVNIGEEMRRLTLSVIGTSLFGSEFSDSAQSISTQLGHVMKRAGRVAPFITFLKPVTRSYRRFFPHGPSLLFQSERAELDRILKPLIARRRDSSSKDVLSLLLAQYDDANGSLTDEDVRNEMVSFILAGHETTATALTWACYLIANRSDLQERLRSEVDSVLGEREPAMEDLPRLTYTTSVFNETLRLFPPAPLFGRKVRESVELAGYKVPVGATVLLSPYVTQRNPQYFEDPDSFVPERWEQTVHLPKFAFFPFGGGAKMCIGEPLARTEGVLILAEIMRRYKLSRASDRPVGINARVTLRPAQPIMLAAQPRPYDAPQYAASQYTTSKSNL